MTKQGGIGWVIFHPRFCTLVSKVIANYTKLLILLHAVVQLGVSLNLYAIDMIPTYVIDKLKSASP